MILAASIILLQIILVHDAPSGFRYPSECCAGDETTGDCHPIPCEEIKTIADGYQWRGLLFKGAMVRISKDMSCHVCHGMLNGAPAYPHCIFLTGVS